MVSKKTLWNNVHDVLGISISIFFKVLEIFFANAGLEDSGRKLKNKQVWIDNKF